MKFILIDYSEVYYIKIVKAAVPPKRGGKFVQLRNEDTEFVVLSPAELSTYHAQIVERFSSLNGLAGSYDSNKMDNYEIYDPEWSIVGGGKWFVDEYAKLIHLFGRSDAYGMFDATGLVDRIKKVKQFLGCELRILSVKGIKK